MTHWYWYTWLDISKYVEKDHEIILGRSLNWYIYHVQKGIGKDCPPSLFMLSLQGSYSMNSGGNIHTFGFWVELIGPLIPSNFLSLLHSFHTTHTVVTILERVSFSKLDKILLGIYCFSTIPSTTPAYHSLPLGSYFDLHKPLLYSKPSKFTSLVINGHRRM